jgi:hypothetical protein
MNLSNYLDLRKLFEEEHPVASLLFSLEDLSDNIIEEVPAFEYGTAWLKLEVGGEEVTIGFTRETIYRLEFDQANSWEDRIGDRDLYGVARPEGDELVLRLPLCDRYLKYPDQLRKVVVENQWKFLDFSFLHEKIDISP